MSAKDILDIHHKRRNSILVVITHPNDVTDHPKVPLNPDLVEYSAGKQYFRHHLTEAGWRRLEEMTVNEIRTVVKWCVTLCNSHELKF